MQIILTHKIYQILSYNKWANERLMVNVEKLSDDDYYKDLSIPFGCVHGLLQHIFYYDAKYLNKVTPSSNHFDLNDLSREYLAESILINANRWMGWIKKMILFPQLLESFDEASNNIIDLSIHNNYHRGECSSNCVSIRLSQL